VSGEVSNSNIDRKKVRDTEETGKAGSKEIPENSDMFLRNVGWLSMDCTALYPIRQLHEHHCENLRSYIRSILSIYTLVSFSRRALLRGVSLSLRVISSCMSVIRKV
jgi:hypothetical protein